MKAVENPFVISGYEGAHYLCGFCREIQPPIGQYGTVGDERLAGKRLRNAGERCI